MSECDHFPVVHQLGCTEARLLSISCFLGKPSTQSPLKLVHQCSDVIHALKRHDDIRNAVDPRTRQGPTGVHLKLSSQITFAHRILRHSQHVFNAMGEYPPVIELDLDPTS